MCALRSICGGPYCACSSRAGAGGVCRRGAPTVRWWDGAVRTARAPHAQALDGSVGGERRQYGGAVVRGWAFCGAFALVLALAGSCFAAAEQTTLDEVFAEPPARSGINVWWHWQGANVTKYGITRDLESMKRAGVASATIFNIQDVGWDSKERFKDRLYAAGFEFHLEPYWGPFDRYEASQYCDVPMSEFWEGTPFWGRARYLGGQADIYGAVGRALGRNLAGAESFTGYPLDDPFALTPRDLKRTLDATFARARSTASRSAPGATTWRKRTCVRRG